MKMVNNMKRNNIISKLITIILIVIIIFCLYKIGIWFIDNYKSKKVKDNYKEIQETIDKTDIHKIKPDTISIDELKKQIKQDIDYVKNQNGGY